MSDQSRPIRIIALAGVTRPRALRGAPTIDWVPASTALEALGEVSLKAPGETDRPVPVVLIPEDAGELDDPEQLTRFARALRRLDQDARLLRIATDPMGCDDAITPETLDALQEPDARERLLVTPSSPANTTLEHEENQPVQSPRAIDASPEGHRVTGDPPEAIAPIEQTETPAPDAGAAPRAAADLNATLAIAAIRGEPMLPIALRILRAQLGVKVELIEPEAGSAPGSPAESQVEAPHAGGATVAWRGHRFGRLVAPGAADGRLREAAEQLGAWLQLERQQGELRRAALTDPLTGAHNRRYFDGFLASAIESASRNRGIVTLLVFDIDDFKRFNDMHGHGAGDEILIETVRLMRTLVRPQDRVCRIGGDEFAVVFTEDEAPRKPGSKPPRDVFQIAGRFQEAIADRKFPKLGESAPGPLSISGGLACYPWDGATPVDLLERADQLALESKRTGKNAITIGPGAARVRERGPAG